MRLFPCARPPRGACLRPNNSKDSVHGHTHRHNSISPLQFNEVRPWYWVDGWRPSGRALECGSSGAFMRIQNSGNGEARVSTPNPSDCFDLGALFDGHLKRGFVDHNVDGTMESMVPEGYLHCVSTMTCGFGGRGVPRSYSNHFVNQIPQRRENHTHLPYRRQRSVIEMQARTVFQRLEVVMNSVAPAPCIALEPDRR
jgi:hypothetical protein